MSTPRSTILACIDGSTYSEAVADYSAWIAAQVDAPLKLLHTIEQRDPPAVHDLSGQIGLGSREELLEELTTMESRRSRILLEQGKLMLERARQRVEEAGITDVATVQRHGTLQESLIDLEEETRAVVVGVRGEKHAQQPHRTGAHLEGVVRTIDRPVLVVNGPWRGTPERMMLAWDGSESARKALELVCRREFFRSMTCHLVHVDSGDQADENLLEDAAGRLRAAGIEPITALRRGPVETSLLDYQAEHRIDLTVMGAFGHSRLRELLFGSLTNRMLVNSGTPVLLLR